MPLYLLLVFLHVLGAVGIFGAWAIDVVVMGQLLQAPSANELRAALALRRNSAPIGLVSMLVVIVTGVWMMIVRWVAAAWLVAAIAEIVFIIIVGVTSERRWVRPLMAVLETCSDRLAPDVSHLGSALVASLLVRITAGVGILALMAMKPGVTGSAILVTAATTLGLGAAMRVGKRRRSIANGAMTA